MSRATLPALFLLAACSAGWGDKGRDPNPTDDEADADSDSDSDADTDADADTDTGDTGEDPLDVDDDGDGWTENEGDCDDTDPLVHPEAGEVVDGIDNDCDGAIDTDADSDGDGIEDCQDFCPIHVDLTYGSGGDGSLCAPFEAIQEGIDHAVAYACYEIAVHPGTYEENVDYSGVDADVYSTGGLDVTVIDGGGAGPCVSFQTGESAAARLSGFTVTNGSADRGAGIYVYGASPAIEGNLVTANTTAGSANMGGGLYLYDSDSEVTDNTISLNDAGYGGPDDGGDGGGIAILYGAPLIAGNLVLDNTAGDGGGLWVAHGEAIVANNVFDGNAADDQGRTDDAGYTLFGQGGGVDFQADTAGVWMGANILTNNFASSHGGGIAITGYYVSTDVSEPVVENNTVAFNAVDGTGYGAGVVVWGVGAPEVVNNAIVSNAGAGLYCQYANADVRYNDSYGNSGDWEGATGDLDGVEGNLSVDGGFVGVSDDGDWTNDDFGLKAGSALVDAGDPGILDADGSVSDVGAYGGPNGSW